MFTETPETPETHETSETDETLETAEDAKSETELANPICNSIFLRSFFTCLLFKQWLFNTITLYGGS